MEAKSAENTGIAVSKSFMTEGPMLHYSHEHVVACWILALLAYIAGCFFWSKIIMGSMWSFDFNTLYKVDQWYLGRFIVNGVDIFEYPWQILVVGLLMGVLAISPILISQLMSFSYSIPFIISAIFIGNLPGFAIFLTIGCIAAACRPLRFRSRFIAVALCTSPMLFYWAFFGGGKGVEPIQLGFSFTPWICAWLCGLAVAGVVLAIGHFTRYRPGVAGFFSLVVLFTAYAVFQSKTGFAELDYQLYVAQNNPAYVSEFHDHKITESLDGTIAHPATVEYLASFFYPREPILLRAELKRNMQIQLATYDCWPSWFTVPDELDYKKKRVWLFEQYDRFITRRSKSKRMPIALYYKALLSEYSPDVNLLGEQEILHFYNDYPFEKARKTWYRLYSEFGESPESIEARWRIAKDWAGNGKFDLAEKILADAEKMALNRLTLLKAEKNENESLFRPFRPPAESVMTISKLEELLRKVRLLRKLIGDENQSDKADSAKRLAKFVMLNPHALDYARNLQGLLEEMTSDDPLRDNVLLAQIMLVSDDNLRAEKLMKLSEEFKDKDAGEYAMYELSILKVRCQQGEANTEKKHKNLVDARSALKRFIEMYPESIYANQVKELFGNLPAVE